jgi:hypothetical protein
MLISMKVIVLFRDEFVDMQGDAGTAAAAEEFPSVIRGQLLQRANVLLHRLIRLPAARPPLAPVPCLGAASVRPMRAPVSVATPQRLRKDAGFCAIPERCRSARVSAPSAASARIRRHRPMPDAAARNGSSPRHHSPRTRRPDWRGGVGPARRVDGRRSGRRSTTAWRSPPQGTSQCDRTGLGFR